MDEYLGVIVAIGFGMFTIVAAMITMLLWTRSEANSDRRDHFSSFNDIREEIARLQNILHRMERRK